MAASLIKDFWNSIHTWLAVLSFPIVVSVIALLISLASFYVSYQSNISPPKVRIAAGTPIWMLRPPVGTTRTLGVVLPLLVVNDGAKTGIVEDLVLTLESVEPLATWRFIPTVFVDEKQMFKLNPNPDINWMTANFHPVSVPGKSSSYVAILFVPESQISGETQAGFSREKGVIVNVLSREADNEAWSKQHSFEANITRQFLQDLQNSNFIATPHHLEDLRKRAK